MPLSKAEVSGLFNMTPEGALRYLELKGLNIRVDPAAMSGADHAYAFGFANLTRLDIAQDLVNGLRESLKNGQTVTWYQNNLAPILKKKGWWGTEENIDLNTGEITHKQLGNPARLATIFRTTTQGAYNAERYQTMLANAKNRPYWRYVAVMDAKTRPSHARLHNKVFHYLDPIWQFIFPPNGFNCRCRVEALTEEEVKALGLAISKTEEAVTQQVMTGEDESGKPIYTPVRGVRFTDTDGKPVTFFPDVGFDNNPALQVWKANLDKYDIELARPYVKAGLDGPELAQLVSRASAAESTGDMLAGAVLSPADASAFSIKGRTAWLTEHNLAQQLKAKTLPPVNELPRVQGVIESPTVVVSDSSGLLLFSERPDGDWYQVSLDDNQVITQFMVVNEAALSDVMKRGKVLKDGR
ncbi:minor capsid protein [Budviciaceae bacterium CWB-B4]|uniref:Minor capsid protein n=1 Tax=Limnobaculum xujianqingii TaxID=2738837 RepID=A0A9D7AH20_9GAMM|nr:phage minor head protein [Limnobaculum xujianqingii]MBK5072567.1 minor capsid protein [Limnobaculum xujianqingii]MBK5175876.1 minor capsid protein [Limnobaculum xujianqingii]